MWIVNVNIMLYLAIIAIKSKMIFHVSKEHKSELVKEQITEKHIITNAHCTLFCQILK